MKLWLILLLFQPTQDSTLSLLVVGDVMLGNRYIPIIQEQGYDYPWQYLKGELELADLRFCNLEAPFGVGGTPANKKYTFRVPPDFVNSLIWADFDIVGLANNHIMDYGVVALDTTLAVLKRAGIEACGAGINLGQAAQPRYIERKGIKVAFLAFSCTYPETFYATAHRAGTAPGTPKLVKEMVREADSSADLVVVSFHWGAELMSHPKPYQRSLARSAIDAGADLVLGHHPHVIQGIEVYKGAPIFYSLGNCTFGSRSASASGISIRCQFLKDGIETIEIVPLLVNSSCNLQPRPLTGNDCRQFLERLEALSFAVGIEIDTDRGYLRLE